MREPRPLQQWLDNSSPLQRARQLALINRSLDRWCDEPWVRQLRIANLRGGTLVVYSSSAAALVPLRHRRQAFLEWLNQQFQLGCTELDVRVRPGLP